MKNQTTTPGWAADWKFRLLGGLRNALHVRGAVAQIRNLLWSLDIFSEKSQRDFASKFRVGAKRLPWVIVRRGYNPNGVASGSARTRTQPFQGGRCCPQIPRVARAEQPWALRRNPVGILAPGESAGSNNFAAKKMFKSALPQSVFHPTVSSVGLCLALFLSSLTLSAQTRLSNLVFTVATTTRDAASRDWSYVLLNSPEPRLLAGKRFVIYSKSGYPTNAGA